MATIIIAYASKYGQTAKIAARLADRFRDAGHTAEAKNIADGVWAGALERADLIVIGAPVYVGKHPAEMAEFVRKHREALSKKANAFYSVSMSAAEHTPNARGEVEKYLKQFQEATGWKPGHVRTFAGALRYSEYGLVTRLIMRMISKAAGHDTDTSRDYEYTDWARVDAFASELIAPVPEVEPEPEPVLGHFPRDLSAAATVTKR